MKKSIKNLIIAAFVVAGFAFVGCSQSSEDDSSKIDVETGRGYSGDDSTTDEPDKHLVGSTFSHFVEEEQSFGDRFTFHADGKTCTIYFWTPDFEDDPYDEYEGTYKVYGTKLENGTKCTVRDFYGNTWNFELLLDDETYNGEWYYAIKDLRTDKLYLLTDKIQ